MTELTREQILSMEPGRELNRIVALNVMGYEPSKTYDGWIKQGSMASFPKPYSTDMSAAWEVVEKMRKDGFAFELSVPGEMYGVRWAARFGFGNEHLICEAAPEAICKAALLASIES